MLCLTRSCSSKAIIRPWALHTVDVVRECSLDTMHTHTDQQQPRESLSFCPFSSSTFNFDGWQQLSWLRLMAGGSRPPPRKEKRVDEDREGAINEKFDFQWPCSRFHAVTKVVPRRLPSARRPAVVLASLCTYWKKISIIVTRASMLVENRIIIIEFFHNPERE